MEDIRVSLVRVRLGRVNLVRIPAPLHLTTVTATTTTEMAMAATVADPGRLGDPLVDGDEECEDLLGSGVHRTGRAQGVIDRFAFSASDKSVFVQSFRQRCSDLDYDSELHRALNGQYGSWARRVG
jgi:hypothetical protein